MAVLLLYFVITHSRWAPLVIKLFFLCFGGLRLGDLLRHLFTQWETIVHWFRTYKKAKKAPKAQEIDYNKRHALIRKTVAW
jgi:hypothetical protein